MMQKSLLMVVTIAVLTPVAMPVWAQTATLSTAKPSASANAPSAVTATPASPTSAASAAATPVQTNGIEVIKNFYNVLATSMKQGDQLGYAGRYKKLDPAIKTAFDLPFMTRIAVGPEWSKATPDEQKQLVSAFSDFSVATYANQFKSYSGEIFKITGQKAQSDGSVLVETQLVPKDQPPVDINYMMKADASGNLKIIDVLLDGAISQLAARRSEFTSIVRRDGIPALLNSLDGKAKEMGPNS